MCLFGGDSTELGKIRELLTKYESKHAVSITRSDLAPLPLRCGNKVVELGSWSFSIECDGRFWRHTAASFRHAMPGFCEHFFMSTNILSYNSRSIGSTDFLIAHFVTSFWTRYIVIRGPLIGKIVLCCLLYTRWEIQHWNWQFKSSRRTCYWVDSSSVKQWKV